MKSRAASYHGQDHCWVDQCVSWRQTARGVPSQHRVHKMVVGDS